MAMLWYHLMQQSGGICNNTQFTAISDNLPSHILHALFELCHWIINALDSNILEVQHGFKDI